MNKPEEEEDELLREAALGRLARNDPRVAARLANDAEFARDLDQLERARASTERVLREGAIVTEEAQRGASEEDRKRVHTTLEALARGARARRRRGRLFFLGGLLAAAAISFVLLRPGSPATPATIDVWMGERAEFQHAAEPDGPGRLSWRVEERPGDELWLSFYALRAGARAELLVGPLDVTATTEWHAQDPQLRERLSGAWLAELELRSAGESTLVGSARRSSSP